jgi:GTP diphosphokinase / guanosine-3',5'-bis(diphosphate) 3'-diphosphatase
MNGEECNKKIVKIYRDLVKTCKPFIKKSQQDLLRKAFDLVLESHRPTWEETGEEYLNHSIEVAKVVLNELNLGIPSVICSLLHNLVDHEKIRIENIQKNFGPEISVIVEGYIRLSEIPTEKISLQSENFRKLFLSLIKDIRVILIKLAHRLYDMREFENLTEDKKHRFLLEVNHIYIPIAHRLGFYNIKTELENLWLFHSYPAVYKSIDKKIKESKAKQNAFISDFIKPIERELFRHNLIFEIKGRPKSIYSIWDKMKKQNVEFEEVFDLFAVRIILDTLKENEKGDCWRAYSIVTDIYKPNPQRLRDWITTPKPTGYESLHTTVLGPNGKWVEVQIRTKRMDAVAEQGLAAHWKYKEGSVKQEQEEWMNRIREVIEHPAEKIEGNEAAKIELYSDKIFIFTPEGDLRKLPHGSTVLDFAYDIHTNLGSLCSGARVNGKIVPIRHVLKNGDKVQVITAKNQKPKMDWLSFVVTAKAKGKIKRAINEFKFQEAELGKEILRRKLRNRKIPFSDTAIDKLLKHNKLKSSIDLYYLIAIGKIDLSDLKKLLSVDAPDEFKTVEKDDGSVQLREKKTKTEEGVEFIFIGDSIEKLGYELGKCCHPVLGDDVFGFIAVGKGITIHRISCPNARQLKSKFDYRVINVKWRQTGEHKTYLTTIQVSGKDELGVLNSITRVISEDLKVNMVSVNVETPAHGKFTGKFKVSVKDTDHIEMLIHKILKVKGVKNAKRLEIEI